MDHKAHHPVAVAKFIVMPGNELDKVVMEGSASPIIEGRGVGVTVKIAGDDLVLSVDQDALEGALQHLLHHLLASSYLAAFSRWQVRSTTDTLGGNILEAPGYSSSWRVQGSLGL